MALLDAALVAVVDQGPQARSIAIARMSVPCGLPLNGAMASGINVLDDVHGGAKHCPPCIEPRRLVGHRFAPAAVPEHVVVSVSFHTRKRLSSSRQFSYAFLAEVAKTHHTTGRAAS